MHYSTTTKTMYSQAGTTLTPSSSFSSGVCVCVCVSHQLLKHERFGTLEKSSSPFALSLSHFSRSCRINKYIREALFARSRTRGRGMVSLPWQQESGGFPSLFLPFISSTAAATTTCVNCVPNKSPPPPTCSAYLSAKGKVRGTRRRRRRQSFRLSHLYTSTTT